MFLVAVAVIVAVVVGHVDAVAGGLIVDGGVVILELRPSQPSQVSACMSPSER